MLKFLLSREYIFYPSAVVDEHNCPKHLNISSSETWYVNMQLRHDIRSYMIFISMMKYCWLSTGEFKFRLDFHEIIYFRRS